MGSLDPQVVWLLSFGSLTAVCLLILIVNYRLGEKALRFGVLETPEKITLVPTSTDSWDSFDKVQEYTEALTAQGFQRLEDFRVPEMGLELRVFLAADQRTCAVVYLIAQAYVDLFTAFEDGTTLTVSNYSQSAAPQMPGAFKILRPRDNTEDLWRQMTDLRNRVNKRAVPMDRKSFQEHFLSFYSRHMSWYKSYLALNGQAEQPPALPPMHDTFDFLVGETLTAQLGLDSEQWARLLTKAVIVHDKLEPVEVVDELARVFGEELFPAETPEEQSSLPPRYLAANLLGNLSPETRPSKHTISVDLEKVDVYLSGVPA